MEPNDIDQGQVADVSDAFYALALSRETILYAAHRLIYRSPQQHCEFQVLSREKKIIRKSGEGGNQEARRQSEDGALLIDTHTHTAAKWNLVFIIIKNTLLLFVSLTFSSFRLILTRA